MNFVFNPYNHMMALLGGICPHNAVKAVELELKGLTQK